MTEKEKFLTEFEVLIRKHGLIIDGCGCCDSPWIRKLEESSWIDFDNALKSYLDHLRGNNDE
jgi:hypothetical protein